MTNLIQTKCARAARAGVAVAIGAALLPASGAAAQTGARILSNPPVLQAAPARAAPLKLADSGAPVAGEQRLDLDLRYVDGEIFNPARQAADKVRLRAYVDPNGDSPDPSAPYSSPMIVTRPGETVRVTLNNRLPADATCGSAAGEHINIPHCFNGTNLHSHGLWVNPSGNGDNVLLSINPGVSFQYEYNIPADHPAGTFWYHTHRHGSTALQVSSGMAGALIVRGDRLPTEARNGDIDTLLPLGPAANQVDEQVLVFQQIQYYCLADEKKRDTGANETYDCEGKTGRIESYDAFGPGSWIQSGRFTSINGHVLPTIRATQGKLARWRMIHGGVRDTIALKLRKMDPRASLDRPLTTAQMDNWVRLNCSGDDLPFQLVAADGLTMAAAYETKVATFQPGYRFDGLVVLPEAGAYCVIDEASPEDGSIDGRSPLGLLAVVDAAPGTPVPVEDIRRTIAAAMASVAAGQDMPPAVGAAVDRDLRDGLKFSRYIPHPDVGDDEVTGYQQLTFFIDTSDQSTRFEVGSQDYAPRAYDPGRIDRQLPLGAVEEWSLESRFVSHPFHIHVNPFQVISIKDPNGKEVSLPGSVDDGAGTSKTIDPQYAGLNGVWKDTLWVKSLLPASSVGQNAGAYTITVRTRYQRYIGEFVLHCHILDHEDQGMMQNVAIVLPAGEIGAPGNGMTGHGGGHIH